ncbi:MAG: hypothetical protein EZS28_012330 [Streblomastix strix]|uniref:Uncharacterized protein n=1 Tax=Streblomastix strix TaxID=222440 RepID=A0A5J4WB73_9EUKA|nr:MAG: hypothetical protein EZS28_012330 [Streblomastix strix]
MAIRIVARVLFETTNVLTTENNLIQAKDDSETKLEMKMEKIAQYNELIQAEQQFWNWMECILREHCG